AWPRSSWASWRSPATCPGWTAGPTWSPGSASGWTPSCRGCGAGDGQHAGGGHHTGGVRHPSLPAGDPAQTLYAAVMQRPDFRAMPCSIARTMAVVGEPWTPLILRDVVFGITKFDELQRDLGVATNILTDRLTTLVEHGLLTRTAYQRRPLRYRYELTDKG